MPMPRGRKRAAVRTGGLLSPDTTENSFALYPSGNHGVKPVSCQFSTGTSAIWKCDGRRDVLGWLRGTLRRLSGSFDKAIQGNLDPLLLFADPSTIKARALRLLEKTAGRPGYIFNLGHGILPETPVDNVLTLVEAVHEFSRR